MFCIFLQVFWNFCKCFWFLEVFSICASVLYLCKCFVICASVFYLCKCFLSVQVFCNLCKCFVICASVLWFVQVFSICASVFYLCKCFVPMSHRSLGKSTETPRFTRRVRVSEIIKPWRVSDILHSLPKGFSVSYCEICQQILLCFLKLGSKFGHLKSPSDVYLRLAGAQSFGKNSRFWRKFKILKKFEDFAEIQDSGKISRFWTAGTDATAPS